MSTFKLEGLVRLKFTNLDKYNMAILSDLTIIKYGEKIKANCDVCKKDFEILGKYKKDLMGNSPKKRGVSKGQCCSKTCMGINKITLLSLTCKNCGKAIKRRPSQLKKVKNSFCDNKCAGIYNAKHKTTGNRRAKLELWLEGKLSELYPNLKILFNDTSAIKAELDIYIPELNIAFELNGIFHYENIFGTLSEIQTRDERKVSLCANVGIGLCVIDTSNQRYFKVSTSFKYLDIIKNIINERIVSKTI